MSICPASILTRGGLALGASLDRFTPARSPPESTGEETRAPRRPIAPGTGDATYSPSSPRQGGQRREAGAALPGTERDLRESETETLRSRAAGPDAPLPVPGTAASPVAASSPCGEPWLRTSARRPRCSCGCRIPAPAYHGSWKSTSRAGSRAAGSASCRPGTATTPTRTPSGCSSCIGRVSCGPGLGGNHRPWEEGRGGGLHADPVQADLGERAGESLVGDRNLGVLLARGANPESRTELTSAQSLTWTDCALKLILRSLLAVTPMSQLSEHACHPQTPVSPCHLGISLLCFT